MVHSTRSFSPLFVYNYSGMLPELSMLRSPAGSSMRRCVVERRHGLGEEGGAWNDVIPIFKKEDLIFLGLFSIYSLLFCVFAIHYAVSRHSYMRVPHVIIVVKMA